VWLALYIPALPLQAFSHTLIETAPVAVLERGGRGGSVGGGAGGARAQHSYIVARNLKAARLGITLHSTLAQATALSDTLITLPREPLREVSLLTQLAEASSCITPNIHIQETFGLLLEVSASLTLFGGAHALHQRAEAIVQAQRIRAHVVLAPTASGARWLARAHRQLVVPDTIGAWLDDLCLENTDFSAALISELHALNLHSLEALRRLPSAELNRRFGTPVTLALARAYAEATETLAFWQPEVCFDESVEFLDPAREQSHWMPGVDALVLQLQDFLRARAATTRTIEFRFHLGSQSCTQLPLLAAHGTHLASDWLRLFNARIERLPITHEISRISLSCERTEPMQFADVDLFEKSKERDREWSALTTLLKQRLGEAALRPPGNPGNALPESTTATHAAETGVENLRPTWLVDPPRPLTAREVSVFTQSFQLQHPERIHEHWSHPDGAPCILRDYYIARTPDHRALWVFRERLRNAWFLQGVFA
jgi:protein ImuB